MEKIISKNLITAIPGIGAKYAKRLSAAGIKKPRDLLKQYEKLDKDPHRFIHWMKKECNANSGHAKKACAIVNGFNSNGSDGQKGEGAPDNRALRANTQKPSAVTLLRPTSASNANQAIGPLVEENRKVIDKKSAKLLSTEGKVTLTSSHSSAKDTRDDTDAKDALNHHLFKLREQFSGMHNAANQKMLELQTELGKMQHMSHEFDVLAEFLSSEERLTVFEQNFDRLQKTVLLTEGKIHQINTNYGKMGRMMQQINDTTKKQTENNAMAIDVIGEKLSRWETKLGRVVRKMSNPKIDGGEMKANDLVQLKGDIEHMLNERLTEFSTDMEKMKNVISIIITLIVLKMFVFDLFIGNDLVAQ